MKSNQNEDEEFDTTHISVWESQCGKNLSVGVVCFNDVGFSCFRF